MAPLVFGLLAGVPAGAGQQHARTTPATGAVAQILAELERQADQVRTDVDAARARTEAPPLPLARDVSRLRDAARALPHRLIGQPWTIAAPLLRRADRLQKTLARLDDRIHRSPEPSPPPVRDPATLGTGAITGRITDARTGAPLQSTRVEVLDADGDFIESAYTDATGMYQADSLAAGSYFVLSDSYDHVNELFDDIVCDPSCSVTSGTPVPVVEGQTTSGINFGLLPLGVIEGTILDATTLVPLEGAETRLFDAQGSTVGFGQAGPDGRYQIARVHPGVHFVRAQHQAYIDEMYDDMPCQPSCDPTDGTPVLVGAGSSVTGIDFRLRLGGSISGAVTEAGSGETLAFIRVEVYASDGAFLAATSTGATGRYQLFDLPTGTYFALTDSSSYANELYDNMPCASGCDPTDGTPIAVTVGQERPATDFALVKLGSFSGRVTDVAGAGLSTQVRAIDAQGAFSGIAFTDEDGSYQISGLLTGNHFAFTSTAVYLDELYDGLPCEPSCVPTSGTPIPVATGANVPGVDFRLDLGGSITGSVRRQVTNAAVPDARVQVYRSDGAFVDSEFTNGAGTFVVRGLTAGTFFATAEAFEFLAELYQELPCSPSCAPTSGTPITVAVAQQSAGVDFTLTRLGRIAGRVTETGTALPVSTLMWLYTSAGQFAAVTSTDSTGEFLFVRLAPGTYYVRTDTFANVVDELYDDRTCEPTCVVTLGTGVTAALDTTTSGIDFVLRRPVFADVPVSHFAWRWVEALYNASVTSGCAVAPLRFCPDANVSRAQMAVFLLRAKEGPAYQPPAAQGQFGDVPASDPFARWIEEIARRGITSGCSVNPPLYCPSAPTTRAQMAPLLLVTREGAGYFPPDAVGVFQDLPASDPFARWVEELVRRHVTSGCSGSPPLYCPGQPTTRAQMAVFLTATFGLPMP